MLRRETKDGPWLLREGVLVSPMPTHVALQGTIPSMLDLIGHYVLVDESWADTDRPLYMHLPVKRDMGGGGGGSILRVASGGYAHAPLGGLEDVANNLEYLARTPSGGGGGGFSRVSSSRSGKRSKRSRV